MWVCGCMTLYALLRSLYSSDWRYWTLCANVWLAALIVIEEMK